MPDRLVRDELLTSERYWACSAEARCLFLSIVLSADDAARYTGAPFALRTKCMAGTVSHERIESILSELVDADLVRRYMHEGKPFLFVPRFGNRKRYVSSSKYPEPPKEINDLYDKKTDSRRTQVSPKADSGQPQDSVFPRAGVGVVRGRGTPLAAAKIKFDRQTRLWSGITDDHRALWTKAYPAIDIALELAKAAAWLDANPANAKSNYSRFLNSWFQRTQDRAPPAPEPRKLKLAL